MFASTIPDLDRRPGAPAILRTAADDPVAWAAEHRDALRAAVAEHGALLVRGLGLCGPRAGRCGVPRAGR